MKRMARWFVAVTIFSAAALAAGNGRDPWLWAYVGVFFVISGVAIYSITDDLARERFTPPSRGADSLSLRFVRIVALAHIAAGVADSRFGWTHVSNPLRALGLIGFAASFLLIIRAMTANRFFSSVVRVQNDRGHHVIDTGPYAVVRHPGYVGMLLFAPLSGLALGSWIAFAVAFLYVALIFRRVLFEDRFLQENLPGYRAYAAKVRYRLVPGLW